MDHNVTDQGSAGTALPLLSESACGTNCSGSGSCSGSRASQATVGVPQPPAQCCGAMTCVPITDADGRELGPNDWGYWLRHQGYQAPRPEQLPVYEENRRRFLDLSAYLFHTLPPSADRTHVLRELGMVLMAANNTVAAHGVGMAVGATEG